MAPNLAPSKGKPIYDMIHRGDLSISQMAQAAGCNRSTILRISSKIRMFGSVKSPSNKGGRPRSITPVMLEALCEYLLEKPTLYLDEMAIFPWDELPFKQQNRALAALLHPKAGLKKLPESRPESAIQTCVTNTSTSSPTSVLPPCLCI